MSRILWTNDIHLNFVSTERIIQFVTDIQKHEPDMILIGGDIGEAGSVAKYLKTLGKALELPIYFVLGNHDYYGGSIKIVRQAAIELTKSVEHLHWLPDTGIVELSDSTALIGHGCWADAYDGNFLKSTVGLNDYLYISELQPFTGTLLQFKLHQLGDESAEYVRNILIEAFKRYDSVYLLTHVPPFRESCVHKGHFADDNWAPHFVCKAVGDVLLDIMRDRQNKKLIVLSGHCHGECDVDILPNLNARTGVAENGHPRISSVIEVQ